jgi:heavy metal sensor kinase
VRTRKSFNPWTRRLPIRVRLTLWYVLLMGLVSLLFGWFLYVSLQHSLMQSIDVSLEAVVSQAAANFDDEDERPAFQNTEHMTGITNRLGKSGFAVRILSPEGRIQDGLGVYGEVPVRVPPSQGYTTLSENDTSWRVYSQPVQRRNGRITGWLQAARSLWFVDEALDNMRNHLMLGVPIMLIMAGIGGFFLSGKALRPIDRITRTAQAIGAGDLSRRIDFGGPEDEVGRLVGTFNHMLDRLQETFANERRFTSDAAHELRTPLTALKGQIGVALNRLRTASEYENTLKNLEQQVDRLIRLSNDLLLLSRIEGGYLSRESTTLNISDLLAATVEQIQPLAKAKELAIETEITPGIPVCGDMDQLIRLFMNLLDNAVKYTPAGGRIMVSAGREGANVIIALHNTGEEIPAEHIPHLFDRFYRVVSDRSRETGGAGLGLSIAYEIARRHEGDIKIRSERANGTAFIVRLPVRPCSTKEHHGGR